MAKVLYITYDGLMEPLGQSQVLQYLKKLAAYHEIVLISYEKKKDWDNLKKRNDLKSEVKKSGIHWYPLRYHKSPTAIATSFDLLQGIVCAFSLTLYYRIQIVHARSYVSSVIALFVKKTLRKKFIFDMRGFWPDEKVDGGTWTKGSKVYNATKWFEKRFFLNADVVVSLTHAGVEEIKKFDYLNRKNSVYEVIPTCTNLELFKNKLDISNSDTIGRPFTIGYVGTVVNWYLFDPVIECYKELIKLIPEVKFFIINREDHAFIREGLVASGIPLDKVELLSADYKEIPAYMSKMDATIFFIKPVFSKKGSAPTKLGEFLGCGVPCLTNSGVGDLAGIISKDKVGAIVDGFSNKELFAGLHELLQLLKDPQTRERCIKSANVHFSLEGGVEKYNQIYASLIH